MSAQIQRLPKSLRKFIRKEKARIRRGIFSSEEAEKKIKELVEKTRKSYGQT